jgi:hypothetical protein
MDAVMDPVVDGIVRLGLGLLLAAAAAHKLRDLAVFRATLAEHRVLPSWLVGGAALAVPALEVALAAMLLGAFVAPALRAPGLAGAALLLAVYAAVIGVNLARGRRHVDCGCAGPAGRQPISGWLVARNLVLVTSALLAAMPVRVRTLGPVDVGTVVIATLALAALHAAAERLLAEHARLDVLRGRTA